MERAFENLLGNNPYERFFSYIHDISNTGATAKIRWLTGCFHNCRPLVGQELFIHEDKVNITLNQELLAAIVTVLVAIKTRSLLWTVIAGVLAFCSSAMVINHLNV